MADIHLFLGDLIQAGQAIKIAQELNYESATGMYLSGYIKVSAGDFKGGIELLEQANKLFQNNPEILRHLGWAYTVTGNVDRGIFLLKRALNLAPEDTLIMEDLGIALLSELSDPFEGEELLRKAGKEHRITEIRALMHI